jgi:MurNAc alpha-1-phosphate uridylyltransferase
MWSHESEPLETAGGIIQALPLLGEQPFVVVNGDIWLRYNFAPLRHALDTEKKAHLILVDNPPHHPQGDFVLVNAVGKSNVIPHDGQPAHTFSGVSVLSPTLFAHLPQGKRPLAPLLREAITDQQVTGEYFAGPWVDVGTPARLAELDQQICAGQL